MIEETKKHKKAKEKSTENIRLGELENSLRKIQNSEKPPSIARITKIRNRYEREEECTTQFFRKFRTKHANTNINELYTVADWNARRNTEESEHTTTDETELLAEASKYYEWLYKPKRTEKEETQTLLKTLSDDPIPKYIAKRTDGEITKEQIKFAIRKLGNNKSPGPDGLPARILQNIRRYNNSTTERSA